MKRGSIFKNVALLGGAKGISQGMLLAATPLLTRLFSPEDFGIFAVFGVFVGLLGGLSCMRYENALPLARDEVEAVNIFVLCGVILSVFLFAFCAVLLAVHDDLADWLKSPALQPYLWLLPIGVFGVGIAQVGQYWAIRIKAFKRVAAAGVAASVVVLVIQICCGIMRFGPAGLIFGRIGGLACSSVILIYPPLRDARSLLSNVSLQSLTEVAKRHRQFPFFFTFSSGISTLGRQMPIIILSIFFGPAVTGLYALTRRVVNVPTILIGEQVRKVYYPYAAELEHVEDVRHLTKTVFVSLVQIALPGVLIIGLVAPELFALIFGELWKDSGTYAQWLCPSLFLSFVCAPLTRLPQIMERQRSDLIFQIVLLVVRGMALVVGGVTQDITLAVGLFAVVSFLWLVGFMVWSANLVGFGMFEVLGLLSIEFLLACPIVAPVVLARFFFLGPDDGLWLLAISAGCALLAAVVLIARKRHIISLILNSRVS
jgi:O-antigen/teichoic acid export membrane protein